MMLYLVATPLGNLSDISLRAIEVLKNSDYILCEDTRYSLRLLTHYEIKKPLRSYHQFNEAKIEEKIIEDLKHGKFIALISDGGTPGISDPGMRLIKRCQKEKIPYTSIPGPCSPILALTLSGFASTRFQFIGFLPKKVSQLKSLFIELLQFPGTSVCFESPKRVLTTLNILSPLAKGHQIALTRELTKIHEECLKGSVEEILEHFENKQVKGELILLIEGKKKCLTSSLSFKDQVEQLQKDYGLTTKEAIKLTSELFGISKKEIYNAVINPSPK